MLCRNTLFLLFVVLIHFTSYSQIFYSLDSIHHITPDNFLAGKQYVIEKNTDSLSLVQQEYRYNYVTETFEKREYARIYDYDENGNRIYQAFAYPSPDIDTTYLSPITRYNKYGEAIYRYNSIWSFGQDIQQPVRIISEDIDTTIQFENGRPWIMHQYRLRNGVRGLYRIKEFHRNTDGQIDSIRFFKLREPQNQLTNITVYHYDFAGNLIRTEEFPFSTNHLPSSTVLSTFDELNRITSEKKFNGSFISSINLINYGPLYNSGEFFSYDIEVDTITNGFKAENYLLADGIIDSTANFTWDFVEKDWKPLGAIKYYYTCFYPGYEDLSQVDMDLNGVPDICEPLSCVYPLDIICQNEDCSITEETLLGGSYYANGILSSDAWVPRDSQVIFKARGSIRLQAGFKVDRGGKFYGLILDCTSPNSTVPKNLEAQDLSEQLSPSFSKDITGKFSVHPNPFGEEVKLFLPADSTMGIEIIIMDQTGRNLLQRSLDYELGKPVSLPIPNEWPAGMYFLYIKAEGDQQVLKLVKQK